jgi:hypothetical protein
MKQLLMLSALILSISAIAQETALIRVYGGPYNEYGNQIIETSDGGYAIIGTTGSYAQGNSKMYLLKLNSNLEKEWTKVYGGNNIEWGKSLVETEDGFLLLGFTNSFGAGGYDVYLVKCDFDGEMLDYKTYGGGDWDFGNHIVKFGDNYVISGETYTFSSGGSDAWVIQIDADGNEIWSGNFGGSQDDFANSAFVANNSLMVVGTSYSFSDKSKVYLLEFDENMEVTERLIGNDNFWNEGTAGLLHSNGDIYITGSIEAGDYSHFLLLRLNNNFELVTLNNNPLGGDLTENGFSIVENTNNQLVMVGRSDSYTGSTGAWLLRTSQMGNFLAGPTFGGNALDIARSVIVNNNNELLVVGETDSYGTGNLDVYLIKLPNTHVVADYILDIEVCFDQLLTNLEPIISTTSTSIFPNPTTSGATIKTEFIQKNLVLYNLAGQKIIQSQPQSNESIISLENYPSGIYILQIITHTGTEFLRIIKE